MNTRWNEIIRGGTATPAPVPTANGNNSKAGPTIAFFAIVGGLLLAIWGATPK